MTAVAVQPEDRFQDAKSMLRFVENIRRADSSRAELIRYLHRLYPKVDFTPPPLPSFENLKADTFEKSVIFATSREGALSVFGRGELPIEWTAQIDAEAMRKLRQPVRPQRRRTPSRQQPSISNTDTRITETAQRVSTPIEARNPKPQRPSPRLLVDAPTQVTAYDPADRSHLEAPIPKAPSVEHTFDTAPAVELVSTTPFRDDEMTVMMDAPPTGSYAPQDPLEDSYDAPTRLSRLPSTDPAAPPAVSAPSGPPGGKIRAIRELDRRSDGTERPRTERRVEVRRSQEIPRKQVEVLRQTVPTDAQLPTARRVRERKPAPEAPQPNAPSLTELIAQKSMIVGGVLLGLAIVVIMLVVITS